MVVTAAIGTTTGSATLVVLPTPPPAPDVGSDLGNG
jgi:hypothetical protein